jgi:hypothetical protein
MPKLRELLMLALVACGGCAVDRSDEIVANVIAQQQGQPQASPASSRATAAPPTQPEREPPARYDSLLQTHWITAVQERGARVKLEDNSVWEIALAYRAETAVWLVGQKITVTENAHPDYPYRLSNAERDNFADATLAPGPTP